MNIGSAATTANPELMALQEELNTTARFLREDIPSAYDATNSAIVGNTRYLGDNTQAWLRNALLASEQFRGLVNTVVSQGGLLNEELTFGEVLAKTAFSFDEFSTIVASKGKDAGVRYIQGLASGVGISSAALNDAINSTANIVSGYTGVISALDIETGGADTSSKEFTKTLKKLTNTAGSAAAQSSHTCRLCK